MIEDLFPVIITCEDDQLYPTKAHLSDAAWDLRSSRSLEIDPGQWVLIKTGIKIDTTPNFCAFVMPRSGLAYKYGVTVLNSPGLIDSGYRDEVGVILINHGNDKFTVNKYDRIAQLYIAPMLPVFLHRKLELEDSDRGLGGFGSSGVS